jgi:hypothetical protein
MAPLLRGLEYKYRIREPPPVLRRRLCLHRRIRNQVERGLDLSKPTPVWLSELRAGCASAAAGAHLAIDSKGNIFLGGSTSSGQLPLVTPLEVQGTDVGCISELSPDGKQLLFSTYAPGNLVLGPQDELAIVRVRTPSPHKLNNAAIGAYPTFALVERVDTAATRPAVISTMGKQ